MAVKNVPIKDGQTIWDISLQLYGSIEYVFKIIEDNPQITNIHYPNLKGMVISYEEQGFDLTNYFKTNEISISTEYPIINDGHSFDESFDLSFN
jgi:hypothetical protein